MCYEWTGWRFFDLGLVLTVSEFTALVGSTFRAM